MKDSAAYSANNRKAKSLAKFFPYRQSKSQQGEQEENNKIQRYVNRMLADIGLVLKNVHMLFSSLRKGEWFSKKQLRDIIASQRDHSRYMGKYRRRYVDMNDPI